MKKSEPVDKDLAQGCIDNYQKIYADVKDPRLLNAYTSSVMFNKNDLIAWLGTLTTDSVSVSFGVYTEECSKEYNVKAGRLTTFFVPYDSASNLAKPDVSATSLADPGDDGFYNLGDLSP